MTEESINERRLLSMASRVPASYSVIHTEHQLEAEPYVLYAYACKYKVPNLEKPLGSLQNSSIITVFYHKFAEAGIKPQPSSEKIRVLN
ncbi:hypothetical protein M8C21_000197 [Ambrosia artemisiifolia]|uniref:Uncharacterized protein n=1 Tax=Ambrosia artemisiifolia TaxID=4212 RepID=A0AAD5D826_AMBAR|nr:hypothetical protein M8C21_000197 [Ambrosia artemisiifolia]